MDAVNEDRTGWGDRTAYLSLRTLIFSASFLPKSWIYALTGSLASAFLSLSKRRKEITMDNIAQAFPDLSEEECADLTKEVFHELSKTVAEILFLMADRFDIDDAVINRDEALATLQNLNEKHPKGWVFMTAHFSNWELGAHFLAKHGYSALAVGREGDNKMIDREIITPFRQKYGNGSIYKKSAAVGVFKALKRGERVGVLLDQKVNEKEGVKVTFFGRDVYTTSLVATMKEKLDIAVIPVFMPRLENGKYRLIVGEAIEEKGDIVKMTQVYNDVIEHVIRDYPAQWFWMHNRWKVAS